jgi:arylsulfatase
VVDSPAHIIDVVPTLAEICEAPIPKTWPGRELRQVSGVSLASLFETGKLEKRPPIHLLFEEDRGLRDGDWKLVSFESQPWELYNLADDRTELNDLAAQHPERVKTMAATWHKMANDVLHAPEDATEPVSSVVSKVRRQWSDYGEAYNVTAAHERKRLQRRKNKR